MGAARHRPAKICIRSVTYRLPGVAAKPARSVRSNSSARLQQSEVVLWTSQKLIEADGSVTTVYYPKPTPGSQVLRPGEQPDVHGHPQRQAVRQAEFSLADARAVLRHGVAAAHSDSLLHGEGRGGRPQEHDRRHRLHRLLLRAHAVHGPGRDDQRRARPDRQQHGRAAAWRAVSASCCSPSSRRSPSRPCWERSAA